ncbi:GNAT family N-acetyltransferase [Demequina zhanjiangensis]|uniref:GNAT family N-acetyltransferase n=1 Tax=Demequina zhanjiangensis TaxID=3051659 RepID=A0ABT8G0T8_9MICO|nr:GNAT family N-acetyltransferase [Demequina sp. SYSU T00b26]MDN4472750.1 GNAT family N-acetyltransferase [Demequina sp. SYSU T00b26]
MHQASIRTADQADLVHLTTLDTHVRAAELERVVSLGRALLAEQDSEIVGWLRWSLFWDEHPFMNMLMVRADLRGNGIGTSLIEAWLDSARASQHVRVMTSTLSTESAQHFYRRLGFVDCGELQLPGEPVELLFRMELT